MSSKKPPAKPAAPPSSDTMITALPTDTVVGPVSLPAESHTNREMTVEQLAELSSPGLRLSALDVEARPDATSQQPALELPERDATLHDQKAIDLPEPPRQGGPAPRKPTRGEVPAPAVTRKRTHELPAGDTNPEMRPEELPKRRTQGETPARKPVERLAQAQTAATPLPDDAELDDAPQRGPAPRRSEQETAHIRVGPGADADAGTLPPHQPHGTAFIRHGHRRVLPGERPEYMPRWAPPWSEPFFALPPRSKLMVAGGVMAGLLVLTLFYQLTRPAPVKTVVVKNDDQGVARLIAEGRQAVAEKRYEQAAAALDAAARLDPDNEELAKIRAFAVKTRDEKAMVDRAMRAIEGKRFDEARKALTEVPTDSEFADQARANLNSLDEEEAQYLLEQGRARMRAGEPERAREVLADLTRLRPALAEQLTQELGEAGKGPKPGPGAPATGPAKPHPAAQPSDAELQSAFVAFADDVSKGADAFDALARTTRGNTQKRALQLATLAHLCAAAQASAGRDLQALSRAVSACAEVSPEAPSVSALRNQVVERARAQAEEAASAEDRGKEAQAYRLILQVKPGDTRADRELKRLLDKAHELYLQGYVNGERDPDGAIRALREALGILTPADADYAKAKAKLAELKH